MVAAEAVAGEVWWAAAAAAGEGELLVSSLVLMEGQVGGCDEEGRRGVGEVVEGCCCCGGGGGSGEVVGVGVASLAWRMPLAGRAGRGSMRMGEEKPC